jgi:hypothetical protein
LVSFSLLLQPTSLAAGIHPKTFPFIVLSTVSQVFTWFTPPRVVCMLVLNTHLSNH